MKYQFSDLLCKAWDKTMTPTLICSIRDDVVCTTSHNCSISTENPEAPLTRSSDEQMDTKNEVMENVGENTATEFSIEQEHLFRTRFEDLLDREYLCW